MISAPEFGVAPEARINRYTVSLHGETPGTDCAIGQWGRGYSDGVAAHRGRAQRRGRRDHDVVEVQQRHEGMRWALARAITPKVPVVACLGNDSEYNRRRGSRA